MHEDDELLGELIANSIENTFGTSDARDFGEMADEGLLEEAALAHALGEMDYDGDVSEEELAEAIAEELITQHLLNQMDEEALAEMIAEEIANNMDDIDEDELRKHLIDEF